MARMERESGSNWRTWAKLALLPLVAFLVMAAAYWSSRDSLPQLPEQGLVALASSPTSSPSATASRTPTVTLTLTSTPTNTASATVTDTPTPTRTHTPTSTWTATPTDTATATATPTPTQTPTPTPLLPTPDGVDRRVRVPILMYHHIDDPGPGAGALRRSLSVPPQRFEEQLHYLKQQGYETITLNDLALHLTVGKSLPPKPIILTFDDGYVDAYTSAFPLLRSFGFVGTFFLVSAPLDAHNPDFLSWEQVQEMHDAGMAFEPHSYDHPDLRNRGFDFLVFQILAPKEAIEARTGETSRFFAYPSGRYDQFVIDVLRSANFWGAVLTEQGATHATDDLFSLRRVRVRGEDDLDSFVRILNLDW